MKPITFKIITFGCRTNQAESRQIGEQLINETMPAHRRIWRGTRLNKPSVAARTEGGRQSNFAKATLDKCDNETMTNVVVINTCCVTGKAEKEVRQAIRKVKKENPNCFLVVVGCWVDKISTELNQLSSLRSPRQKFFSSNRARIEASKQYSHRRDAVNAKKENFCKAPHELNSIFSLVDFVIRNKDKEKLAEILKKQFIHHPSSISHSVYQDKYSKSKKALVKIQDGCDKFCTYCIVPHVRRRSVSRPADKIIGEIKRLIKQGIKEVVLTGIDIASYKLKTKNEKLKTTIKNLKLSKAKNNLTKLLRLILAKTKIKKISFGSMGIEVFDEEFIELYSERRLGRASRFSSPSIAKRIKSDLTITSSALANIDGQRKFATLPAPSSENFSINNQQSLISNHLSSHFHIPIQSGCNATLKRMNRGYKIKDVRAKIKELKKKIPNFSFSTDIIVGFPGETEEEFAESLRNIKEIKKILGKSFKKIHVFRYSSREGTAAAKLEKKWGRVDEQTKKKRASQVAKIISYFSTS